MTPVPELRDNPSGRFGDTLKLGVHVKFVVVKAVVGVMDSPAVAETISAPPLSDGVGAETVIEIVASIVADVPRTKIV
jgi:hypothetical protein